MLLRDAWIAHAWSSPSTLTFAFTLHNFSPNNVSSVHIYYLLDATIKNSKYHNGWRSGVYSMCAKALGFYNMNKSHTIFYEGEDLRMKILFPTVGDCHAFLNFLHETRNQFYAGAEIVCAGRPETIHLSSHPEFILASHYNTKDYDSPDFSDRMSVSDSASVVSLSNPTAHLLMIENPNRFVRLNVYDCHLMSKSKYREESKNANNILRLSWSMHQYFDGLNTQGKHLVPLIAIGFVRANDGEQIEVGPGYSELKYRVTVSIESQDENVLQAVGSMLKAGSQSTPDVDGKIYSFVLVDSATEFQRCLTVKYEETKALWQQYGPGEEIAGN